MSSVGLLFIWGLLGFVLGLVFGRVMWYSEYYIPKELRRHFTEETEKTEALKDIVSGLQHLSGVVVEQEVQQPARGILTTQIFILVQKVRYLLGER